MLCMTVSLQLYEPRVTLLRPSGSADSELVAFRFRQPVLRTALLPTRAAPPVFSRTRRTMPNIKASYEASATYHAEVAQVLGTDPAADAGLVEATYDGEAHRRLCRTGVEDQISISRAFKPQLQVQHTVRL